MDTPLLEHYRRVEEEVASACAAAGRKREDVRLLAVSKFHSEEDIAQLAQAGQRDFGENYLQEAAQKRAALNSMPGSEGLRWHMIGHIQRRKARDIAGEFELIHTLDSHELADEFQKRLQQKNTTQKALLEINLGAEGQKAGIMPESASELAMHILDKCPNLELRGLMCIPPVFDAGDAARPWFAKLRELRDKLQISVGMQLPELSMGMSGDFAAAIAEGATIVRIGTSIFGPRPVKKPHLLPGLGLA